MSDSEEEFDNSEKKRRASISDDDTSFALQPSVISDSDVDSPAPPPKAPEPTWV